MFSPSNSFNPFQFTSDHDTENQIPMTLEDGIHLPNSPFIGDAEDFFSGFLSEQQEDPHKVSEVLGSSLTNHEEAHEEEEEAYPEASNNKAMKIKDKKRVARGSSEKIKQVPRKRSGKKDRHSKIYTAQGPRDRRMRLSLPIARKFFDLQDILGFDKASKTIEWLFKKSKTAINDLKQGFPGVKSSSFSVGGKSTVSSTSESEVVSGVKLKMGDQGEISISGTLKEKRSKGSHKQHFNPVARESREKARARARERTREKMSIKGLDMTKQSSKTNPSTSDPSRHVEDGDHLGLEDGGRAEEVSYHLLQQEMDSTSIVEKLWGLSTSGYSHSLEAPGEANILENEISGFPGRWVIDNIDSNNLVHALKLATGKFLDNNDLVLMNNPLALESNPPTSLPINLMSFSNPNFGNPSPMFLPITNTNFSSYPVGIQFPDIHLSKHGSLDGIL